MVSSFDDSLVEFREFLKKNDYPQRVEWVRPENILLSGRRVIYVKLPVSMGNEQQVRQLFEISRSNHKGILFGTICAANETTYAYAWSPSDEAEAERGLIGDGLKMSAKVGDSAVPCKTVRNPFRWALLRLILGQKQQFRSQLFR